MLFSAVDSLRAETISAATLKRNKRDAIKLVQVLVREQNRSELYHTVHVPANVYHTCTCMYVCFKQDEQDCWYCIKFCCKVEVTNFLFLITLDSSRLLSVKNRDRVVSLRFRERVLLSCARVAPCLFSLKRSTVRVCPIKQSHCRSVKVSHFDRCSGVQG